MHLCKDCKYYFPKPDNVIGNIVAASDDDVACYHPKVARPDPVHGGLVAESCRGAREDVMIDVGILMPSYKRLTYRCGQSAQFWEPRTPPKLLDDAPYDRRKNMETKIGLHLFELVAGAYLGGPYACSRTYKRRRGNELQLSCGMFIFGRCAWEDRRKR